MCSFREEVRPPIRVSVDEGFFDIARPLGTARVMMKSGARLRPENKNKEFKRI